MSASRSRTGRRAPGRSRPSAGEVLARGADGGDRLVLERAGRRAGRRLDLAAAGQRAPWGSARPRRRAADRPRVRSTTNSPPVSVFFSTSPGRTAVERPAGCPQLERAVEDRRLQRRQHQLALALVALLTLAAQQREAARRVGRVRAEALLAVAVGDAVRAERPRTGRAARRRRRRWRRRSAPPRSGCRAGARGAACAGGARPPARGRRRRSTPARVRVQARDAEPLARRGLLVLDPRVADVARRDAERRRDLGDGVERREALLLEPAGTCARPSPAGG